MEDLERLKKSGLEERLREVWKHIQTGLVYPSPYAVFATFDLKTNPTKKMLSELKAAVRDKIEKIETDSRLCNRKTTAILGVSFAAWNKICEDEGMKPPKGMSLYRPREDDPYTSEVFEKSNGVFCDSKCDSKGSLWFHIKSDKEQACDVILDFLKTKLKEETNKVYSEKAISKSTEPGGLNGKVLGCRFSENLNNPTDPISLAKHTLIGAEDIEHFGGSFVLAQRLVINWSHINMQTDDQIEDLIGRKTNDAIIINHTSASHIKASRLQDDNGNTIHVLRLGLPFGRANKRSSSPIRESSFRAKSITLSDEEGIYFAGFCKDVKVLEKIMFNQIGPKEGYVWDPLFRYMKSNLGGFFYIPSVHELGLETDCVESFLGYDAGDWSKLPGMDWSRIDRHYRRASENGLMFYNHQDYLFNMSTRFDKQSTFFKPPSFRILSLLENIFSLWQDSWYHNRKQEEIYDHLSKYMIEYDGFNKPEDIMKESIMIRKGWAIRMTLRLYSSAEYGFRGRKIKTKNGEIIPYLSCLRDTGRVLNGADTFRISPEEIIVGALPNLSLGEGKYLMRYLSDAERLDGFLENLSEASGVGHVVPNYEKVLMLGLKELKDEVLRYQSKSKTQEKRDLCKSSYLALEGISEYCLNYSKLAKDMATQMADGQAWEKVNLELIGARMEKLASHKPDTFVEAVQLLFTFHCCLHISGEPTAIGRMDQLLQPFYERDTADGILTEDEAQEIIDAFFIKMDEKMLQNRIFMEDHQPFGNIGMGGRSGPYPQGASLGQWIQKVTIGGTIADGTEQMEDTKPAYNAVTLFLIRSAGRLPMNAPVLALRTRKDIPEEILNEAAHAILSGGANPILMNDEMLIKGLVQCGDNVGKGVPEEKKRIWDNRAYWNSQVSMKSAQNYACDGCYEPQFPGENWFSLGGLSTLQPLECALNQGKTYSSAGPEYLFGKQISINTKSAEKIKSFKELLDLYYYHFDLLNRKALNQQLRTYGANTKFCPSPLLNVLTEDCLAKGQDFYSGGARYNIYAPCYIALSSTINSLFAIKKMVFDEENNATTLPKLLVCLCCDWGHKMVEPFISTLSGEARISAQSDRFKRLRKKALELPKYGRGNKEIDEFGNKIVEEIAKRSMEAFTDPWPQTLEQMKRLALKYGSKKFPFGLQFTPGVGTFENTVEMGAWNGASADGRRSGTAVASDMSAAPSPADLPVAHQYAGFSESLAGFKSVGAELMTDGAPTDYNIEENFPVEKLVEILKQFAAGNASNMLTITVANPKTLSDAIDEPEMFDLLRVRTGGWTNFFASVFPQSQEQHCRRPLST